MKVFLCDIIQMAKDAMFFEEPFGRQFSRRAVLFVLVT